MKIALFGTGRSYLHDTFLEIFKKSSITAELVEIFDRLSIENVEKAAGCEVVCLFVNDDCSTKVLQTLYDNGTRCLLLQSAGFDYVDLELAKKLNMPVLRVPAYSPYSVAEFGLTLLLTLVRKIIPHSDKTRKNDFTLDGLVGFDIRNCTVGVVGTGLIGRIFVNLLTGFGCKVLAYDPFPFKPWTENPETSPVEYTDLDTLLANSDVVSLHTPLMPATRHIMNAETFGKMKDGSYIINVSRGGLIDTQALIDALNSGKLAGAGLDVVEGENDVFFEKRDNIESQNIRNLMERDNVILSGHCAFLTKEAIFNICNTTIENLKEYIRAGDEYTNKV